MLALLCFCVATEFSVNKDLYNIRAAKFTYDICAIDFQHECTCTCLVFESNELTFQYQNHAIIGFGLCFRSGDASGESFEENVPLASPLNGQLWQTVRRL